jgi:hypothetical protein
MLRIGPQAVCQGIHEPLAPLQALWLNHHDERIKIVKILVDFLKVLDVPSTLRHQGIP